MRYKDLLTWPVYKIHIGRVATIVRVLCCFGSLFFEANAAPPTPAPPSSPAPAVKTDAKAQQALSEAPELTETKPSELVQKQTASIDLMNASIEKQKLSAQSQLGKTPSGAPAAGTFFTTNWTTPAVYTVPNIVPTCTALGEDELKPLVEASAKARNLQVELVRSVIKHESDSYPCAVSEKGALGLMQLMPEVAQQMGVDALDPKQNIEGGSQYLKQLLDRYKGDVRLALAAYNAGPQRVDADKKVPDIPETVAYVDAILKDLTQIRQPLSSGR